MYIVMETYGLAGTHTFFSAVVSAGNALLLLLSLAALYRKLAPKSKWKGNDLSVNATSKLEDMEQDSLGESFELFCRWVRIRDAILYCLSKSMMCASYHYHYNEIH